MNRVPINSEHAGSFYTALGRPQALYIILPFDGKLRLFRGAVMTYREFVRPDADSLDEPSWRALAHTGNVPPPPAFTKNFQADRDAAELIKSFTAGNEENPDYKELSEAVEELQSRVTDRDVPALIAALDKFLGEQPGPSADGIAAALSKLHWESHQKELLALLTRNDGQEVRTIAPILFQRPEALDVTYLSTNLEHVEPPARRVYCALLSRVPQTDQTRATLLRALSDSAPGVRWEAATALANGNENAPQKVNALLERLNDENEYVMAAAVSSIAQLKATNAAAALLTNLQDRLLKPEPSMESLQPQGDAVQSFALNLALNPASTLPRGGGPRRSRPMRPFMAFPGRGEASPARDALIEALGDLNYQPAEESIFNLLDGPHAVSAGKALKELAPEKLARRLEAEACDKKADPLVRDRALQLLGTPPATTSAAGLIPLLDDTTTVPMIARRAAPAGREWRICDRAAATIATLLGRTVRIVPMQPIEQRDQQIEQLRESLKAAY